MTLNQWMQHRPDLVYEELGDVSISKLARLIDDDIMLGAYIREQIERRHKYEMECQNIPREPDTERMREARAINADEERRVYG